MVTVVLPTYNEAPTIVAFLESLLEQLQPWADGYEVLVVDDRSPDGTANVVRARFDARSPVRVVEREPPRSLGCAVRDGLALARSDKVVVMDADFNHDPRVVPYLVKYLDDFDLVIGSRFAAGGEMPERHRHFGSFAINLVFRVVARTQVQDNLSGFFSISRRALDELPFDRIFWGYGDYFFRLVYYALRVPLRILEVPVVYGARTGGSSKTPLVKTALRYLYEIARFRWRDVRPRPPDGVPRPFYTAQPAWPAKTERPARRAWLRRVGR